MSIAVNVKWGKQKFELEIDTAAPVELFKAQLFALTGVPPERMKIMGVKGGAVKDDADWTKLGLKVGQNLMMMGSAEKAPEPPKEATVFAEDMAEVEVAALSTDNPGGLANLGNTCYLNSSLQCMKAIPEISQSLGKYIGGNSAEDGVVLSMREMMADLERSTAAQEVTPFRFVQTFREAFPMFAQRTEGQGGGYVQQDAEECWSTLVSALSQKMKLPADGSTTSNLANAHTAPLLPRQQALKATLGDQLFGVELESAYACLESEAEPAYVAKESFRKIACHISEKTAHLYTALEVNLDEVVEKNSDVLGRLANFSKKSRFSRLPPYLTVQFVRFAWRKDTAKRAKILRTVSFPPILDVRTLCTKGLQSSIAAHCMALEKERDEKAGITSMTEKVETLADRSAPVVSSATAGASSAAQEDDPMGDSILTKTPEELEALAKEAAGAECGDNRTGRYELFAVITHQGRTADGGHYVAWVKKEKKAETDKQMWLVFDDETVAEVDDERIKELHGGGDWHMAYVCLYRKKDTLD